jgi:putative transposase
MAGSYTKLIYHIVFSTRNRDPWITPDIRPRVHQYLGGAIRGEGGTPYAIGGVEDHVHLLLRWRADAALSDLIRNVENGSSSWARETFKGATGWQDGHASFTVSESLSPMVTAYIDGQEEHHKKQTFQEELIEFLERHGVEYNPEYIWR